MLKIFLFLSALILASASARSVDPLTEALQNEYEKNKGAYLEEVQLFLDKMNLFKDFLNPMALVDENSESLEGSLEAKNILDDLNIDPEGIKETFSSALETLRSILQERLEQLNDGKELVINKLKEAYEQLSNINGRLSANMNKLVERSVHTKHFRDTFAESGDSSRLSKVKSVFKTVNRKLADAVGRFLP